MSLPDEIGVSITTEGMCFEFRVGALPQGCALLFPDRGCADEFRSAPDLSAAVARAAASVLDAAAARFLAEFQASLVDVLVRKLDGEKLGAGNAATESRQEAV